MPAEQTSTSTGPSSASTFAKASSTSSGSVTSQAIGRSGRVPAGPSRSFGAARAVGDRHRVAAGLETPGAGEPDAPRAAGDEDDPAH